jgi:hypothetical protein
MICPRCSNEIVLPDDARDELAPRYAWVHCPHPSCGRELVLVFGNTKSPSRMLDAEHAKEEADRAVSRPEEDESVVGWAVGAIVVLCIGLACVVVIGGGVEYGKGPLLVALILGVFILAVAGGGAIALVLAIERTVKARRWMRTLPRASLRLTAQPKAYRT